MDTLEKQGVEKLFGPVSSTEEIINYINNWYSSKK